jgi:hypothetical protein
VGVWNIPDTAIETALQRPEEAGQQAPWNDLLSPGGEGREGGWRGEWIHQQVQREPHVAG